MSPIAPEKDPLVDDVVLMNKLPIHLHKYLTPFLFIYSFAAGVWYRYFESEQPPEYFYAFFSLLFLFHILTVLSCFWSCNVRCMLTCSRATHPSAATHVKVVPTAHNGSTELVPLNRSKNDEKTTTWFEFQKAMYIFDEEEKKRFAPISFPVSNTFKTYQSSKGLADEDSLKSAKFNYGENQMVMVVPEFKILFLERATAPFFVFQVFCVLLWCLDEYWYYSLFTLFMLVGFEVSLVYQQMRNMSEIRKMGNQPYKINVYRSRKWRPVSSDELVAGDIVSMVRSTPEENKLVPCDILLLRGRLIVDEAMLTGESVPQMKEPIEGENGDVELDLDQHARVHVICGGTRVVQHDPPPKTTSSSSSSSQQNATGDQQNLVTGVSRPNDNGCIGYVLRTGFNTSQGKLLRTILFGVKRVTANNLETFAYIVFLLMFAIAAASYVWVVGSADPERNRYKLLLNCILILTSVVPPELPIVLSLAVNSSLLALSKLYVFCTEPFRIPFAGKVDICCFDKTGTLTSDSLLVEGVAATDPAQPLKLVSPSQAPALAQKVIASCHALAHVNDEMIGDPLEQAMLTAVEWNLTKADVMIPKKKSNGVHPLKILHRFHFSSALKRMSTLVSEESSSSSSQSTHLVCSKGAAEVVKGLLRQVPDGYDQVHQALAQRGARVLALAIKDCQQVYTSTQIRTLKRSEVECDLEFVGFIVVSSPLKPDSKSIMAEIKASSHHVTMITGDNPLTACHVGRVLKFMSSSNSLLFQLDQDSNEWRWKSVFTKPGETEVNISLNDKELMKKITKYDLCLTGEGMNRLRDEEEGNHFNRILPCVRIFARVSPKQKELIIVSLKQLGFNVAMCGDGTNDVGALKHAHVGVALLSGSNQPAHKKAAQKPLARNEKEGVTSQQQQQPKGARRNGPAAMIAAAQAPNSSSNSRLDVGSRAIPRHQRARLSAQQEKVFKQKQRLRELMEELEQSEPQFVKLGDASVAAPFSYKLSSTAAVCHIIKQGRCTLVTTLQMFKILALNALILAYSQSVLSIDGVKFSDGQATLQGLLLAGCFLFISRSKPVKVLSKERPLPNIFNLYTILTVTLQFAIHFSALVYLVTEAKANDPDRVVDYEAEFKANLLNSTVYILSIAIQIITFGINYRGNPYMESIWENKSLLYSLMTSSAFLAALLFDVTPDVNDQFEIVHFTTQFRNLLAGVCAAILASSWLVDRSLRFLFGSGRLRTLSAAR